MQAFSFGAQFARESAMLKLPEERRKWGPRTYRKGYYFYSPQSSTVIKSKMAATTISRTRTRFRPPKIRLHCTLLSWRYVVMFDRPKKSILGPFPRVNQSKKYLRTFLCHRISFRPFSSSPFLAKEDMYKSLSLPSGFDSALRSCVTKREK